MPLRRVNVKIFSPLRRHWQFYDTRTLKTTLDETSHQFCTKKLSSFQNSFCFFSLFSLDSSAFFSFFFSKTDRSSFFRRTTSFPRFLSKRIMGDMNNAKKEFTNEERSLLKFQKKQQHGQVVLLLLVLVVLSCIRIRVVVLYCFCLEYKLRLIG